MPARREALLAQLRYLVIEAEAVGPLLADLPPALLAFEPAGEPSILEALARLASRDRNVHQARLARLLSEDDPILEDHPEPEDAPPAGDLAALLANVVMARTALIDDLESLAPEQWGRSGTIGGQRVSVADLAFAITQEDVAVLRTLTLRIHDAYVSERARAAAR